MSNPLVSIVVVTWNSEKDIKDCLESLGAQDYENLSKIVVVDNNSSDKTIRIIKENFPEVDLIESQKNTFFTGGHNLAMNHAIKNYSPEYIMIINPDTKSQANLVSELVKVAESDKEIGIVSPKIKFWNNENEGKINSAGLIYDHFMQGYDRGFMEEDNGQYDKTEQVYAVTGCCMLLRVDMLKQIGMFWEKLKMYLEDLELCIRANKNKWKVIYTGNSEVGHKWMQSTTQNKMLFIDKLKRRNWVLIALRHYKLRSKIAVINQFLFK